MKELGKLYDRHIDISKRLDGRVSEEERHRFRVGASMQKQEKENKLAEQIKQAKESCLKGDIPLDRYKAMLEEARESYPYKNFDIMQQKCEKDAKDANDRHEIEQEKMRNKVCLVTGATSGIGKVTALELTKRGADVVIVGRNEEKCRATVDEIRAQAGNGTVDYLVADLSSQNAVRTLAQQFKERYNKLDVLVNNAGITLFQRDSSVDGIEKTLATNHLAYFMLTNLLSDEIKKSDSARIINVSSIAHTWAKLDANIDTEKLQAPSGPQAYYTSKLANVLFTKELAHRLEETNVTVNALNPGYVETNIGRADGSTIGKFVMPIANWWYGAVSPEKGAETSVYLATSPEVKGVSGKYFEDMKEIPSAEQTYDKALAEQLWKISKELTKMKGYEVFPTQDERRLNDLENKMTTDHGNMTREEENEMKNLIKARKDEDKKVLKELTDKEKEGEQMDPKELEEIKKLKNRRNFSNLL